MKKTKILNEIREFYDIKKIQFYDFPDGLFGCCFFDESIIFIHSKFVKNEKMIFKILFHEIGHLYCYRNGLWKSYHHVKPVKKMKPKEKHLAFNTALKSERWIDNWASKEIKKWFPGFIYKKTYYKKEAAYNFRKMLRHLYFETAP